MAKTITGTLHYLDSGQLVLDWGAGNFLALKFTNNKPEEVKTIKVGLDPSQGSGLVPLDEDMNGVFKITDKDTQKFVIESYDAEDVLVEREEYSLAGLVCERPPIHIHFIDHSTQQPITEVEMPGVGSTYDFEVTAENIPEGATLTISSDDTGIITVSEDEYYTITGVAEGSANILATVTEGGQVIETVELPVDVLEAGQTILIEMEQTIEDPSISYPIFDIDTNTVSAKFTALEIDGETPVTTLTANDISLSVDGEPVSSFTFNYDSTFEDYEISFTHSGNTPSELIITVNYQEHNNEFTEEITQICSAEITFTDSLANITQQTPFTESFIIANRPVGSTLQVTSSDTSIFTVDGTDLENGSFDITGVTTGNGNITLSILLNGVVVKSAELNVIVDFLPGTARLQFSELKIGQEMKMSPVYAATVTVVPIFRCYINVYDKNTLQPITTGTASAILKDGKGATLVNGTASYSQNLKKFNTNAFDSAFATALNGMTQQEVEACYLVVEYTYDGVTEQISSNITYVP